MLKVCLAAQPGFVQLTVKYLVLNCIKLVATPLYVVWVSFILKNDFFLGLLQSVEQLKPDVFPQKIDQINFAIHHQLILLF